MRKLSLTISDAAHENLTQAKKTLKKRSLDETLDAILVRHLNILEEE